LYTSAQFRNSNYVNPLARFNPDPYAIATLFSGVNADSVLRANALRAGLAPNFFVVNPDLLGGANIVENTTKTMFHSMALEFRRRSAGGLQYSGSYVWGHGTDSRYLSKRVDPIQVRNDGTVGDVTHAFKLNAIYELPFGQGRRFANQVNGVVDRIIGGWQVSGLARVQSGRLIDLGNVRLVGMSKNELQDLYKLRITPAGRVFTFPQEIIDESFKAFSVSATSPTGYGSLGPPSGRYIAPADSFDCIERIRGEGQCGLQSVVLTGPMFKTFDVSVVKRVEIAGRFNAEFRVDALNVFNNVNFVPVTGITTPQVNGFNTNRMTGAALSAYEVTNLVGGNQARIVQLVSRLRW
jgi:hypothetical protein